MSLWNPKTPLNQPPGRGCVGANHLVRAHDPITSVMAAEHAGCFAGAHCARIVEALKTAGNATAHELQALTGLTVVQIDRRLPELLRNGKAKIRQHENLNDVIRGGCRVWEAV